MNISSHVPRWLVRAGLAFVFIYFGIDKLIHPDLWIGWIPEWLQGFVPMALTNLIKIFGVGEIFLGLLMLVDRTVRLSAALMSLFFIFILVQFGINEVMVRDIGLLCAALSLVVRKK